MTQSGHRSEFAEREVMECRERVGRLVKLDVGRSNHLCPFLSFPNDKFSKVGGRHWRCHGTELGKVRLHFGVGESNVNLRSSLLYFCKAPISADAAATSGNDTKADMSPESWKQEGPVSRGLTFDFQSPP